MKKIHVVWCALVMVLISLPLSGALLKNVPVTVTQPNGEALRLFASGDEFYNWLHDAKGYTIIQDPETGYYEYALIENGVLRPSGFSVSSIGSANDKVVLYLGISPGLKTAWEKRKKPAEMMPAGGADNSHIVAAPRTGTLNNLVIFIRFSGESEFTDATSAYEAMFNTAGANSMQSYFKEVSYNALTINTTFYPTATGTVLSYQDSQARGYYQPYNASTNPNGYTDAQRAEREHALLRNAVNSVASSVPTSLNLDGDGDGNVDNVCFVVYGGPTAWNTLLWPHAWSLYSYTVNINGKRVYTYNFQLQTSLLSSNSPDPLFQDSPQAAAVGTLCHEMFHALGAPDLYHYSFDGLTPAGKWDLMETSGNPPVHMLTFMKYRYGGWIGQPPLISSSGVYTLNPVTSSTNNCYRIASPNSANQFFVVEYRKKTGTFENSIPGSGLVVSRYDTRYNGNANGPPDELYVYRPGGTRTVNGTPDNANFGAHVGRTAISDTTNPSSFLQDGSAGGLNISNISAGNGTISFAVTLTGQYHLTIAATTGGTTNPAPGDYFHANGSTVQVTAIPSTYYEFVNWSGSATGTANPVSITMTQDRSVTANFRRLVYPPINSSGEKVLNRSLSQSQYINIITFAANPNNVDIQRYRIVQIETGGVTTEIASLDANTFVYWHRGVDKSKTYFYYIIAVNSEGRESPAAYLVI